MSVAELSNVSKSFGPVVAVDDVSLTVNKGEFFGLLGPNGAGKTTSIRILLDIFKPDRGSVSILGGPMTEAKKDRIGYMPEERGLYQDIPLERALTYLAGLKGLPPEQVRQRLPALLERFDLAEHKHKKVKELSKGMQQKAQIISTIIHQPELIIIDEPFSGLDPVNTQMVKDLLRDLHQTGTTLIMSTHQMHQVEELCERILLMDHGKVMLYGPLSDIRQRFSGHALQVRTREPVLAGQMTATGVSDDTGTRNENTLSSLPGVLSVEGANGSKRLNLSPNADPQAVLRAMVERGIVVEQFELALPTLDEIFIRVVKGDEKAQK